MNKKAEAFQKYLEEKDIKVFTSEEFEDSPQHITVFRSYVTVEGQQLPLVLIFDDSIFVQIRVQISPKAKTEENETALYKMLNEENQKYKPFKLYLDNEGSVLLDTCLIAEAPMVDEEEKVVSGGQIYNMFDVIIQYLNDSYRNIMKTIW